MSKFKVGDRVRVRGDLSGSTLYNNIVFSPLMKKHRGHVYTIDEVRNSPFRFKLRGNDDVDNWWFSEDMLESVEFTKDDLKNGMIVEYRDGSRRMVLRNTIVGLDAHNSLLNYRTDLTENNDITRLDIVKVFDVPNCAIEFYDIFGHNESSLSLLWERKEEVKEITMDDIEKKFGCKVKIINREEK